MQDKTDKIELSHGSGGRKTQELIRTVFQKNYSNIILDQMLDAALFEIKGTKLAFSTDSFVINPIFFPGGDIGKLAVYGTVNDLAVSGAKPYYMSVGMILEEGFSIDDLRRIADSMALAANHAKVQIVTGDTKVVEKGSVDKIFINTSAIGIIPSHIHLHPANICPGDVIIVSGQFGEHGLVIKTRRQEFAFDTPIESDCASLLPLTQSLLAYGNKLRCMRDITRGGVATTLNELAEQSSLTFKIEENLLPVSPVVKGACKMLGMDPLYLANEGKLVAIVAPDSAEDILHRLHCLEKGKNASIIGRVERELPGMVIIKTSLGGQRILPMLEGDPLPRLC
ncbi:hydrogenase expression/formation protein HypE [Sporomusaceae bacterium BoRhaA]|uniref:hydrogenase expression/formation protein HypE n=1 Tax=Pelorhabdus rhamnosifermentans TaxID=2772457 RepID=UPI001C063E28|nr:hydrogenase expression/formation protein HypE [Pelorhabdus rhamnosifermentans]MBU2701248.1 hydrogenase expression/formation protein HypE [Pelorhabdus rhamnosifermentans]